MELKNIKYFVEVAEQKSMHKAAAELYVTQPSLSRAVHTLEEELGEQLLIRSNHGVILTEAGENAYFYAKSIMNQMNCLETLREHRDTRVEAKMGISVARVILKDTLMLEYRGKVQAQHISIRVLETGVENAIEQLAAMKSDIALVTVNTLQYPALCKVADIRDLEVHEIRRSPVYVHMNEVSPLMQKERVAPEDLIPFTQIHLPHDYFSNLNYGAKKGLTRAIRTEKTITMNNYHSILCMLKHSDSFIVGGDWQIEELARGGIKSRKLEGFDEEMRLIWLKRKRETLADSAEIFLQMLLDNYRVNDSEDTLIE